MKLLPVWMESLTPEMEMRARDELGETPEIQARALRELRELINETVDFYCLEDDTFLIRFLRVKKYNVTRAFSVLKNYYAFKKTYPGIMTEKLRDILKMDTMTALPVRAPDGGGILLVSVGRLDLEKYTVEEYFSACMVICEVSSEMDAAQVCGGHLIFDFKGISLKKLRHFTHPAFISLLCKGVENVWPYRICSVHAINDPFYFTVPYNLIYPMLPKKIKERIHFHGSNVSNLLKYFPRECLPEQMGGTLGPDVFSKQNEIIITKQLEMERTKKYSFHRQQKSAKKHSTCGLEQNSNYSTSFHENNTKMSKVAI